MVAPHYPKGDLRRMLAVLGAIEAGHGTLVRIVAATGLDKKTITTLIAQAGEQAGVSVRKTGATYVVEDWGPALKKAGAREDREAARLEGAWVSAEGGSVGVPRLVPAPMQRVEAEEEADEERARLSPVAGKKG